MLCGRAALLVSRFGPSASVVDVSDTCSGGLNYIQARGRRRTMVKPPWMPDKYVKIRDALPKEDREYLERELQLEVPQRKLVTSRSNPSKDKNLQVEVHESPVSYSFDYSKRIGLVGRKIGMAPQWLSDGYRTPCTLIHIYDNHVLQVTDPSTWYKRSLIGKRKAFGPFGPVWNVLVGAFDKESVFYTDNQRRIFEKAKVPCKEQVISFVTSEDAIVKPGTKLDVRHFQVGQYVSVSGKTIDWGFQGVMHRWGFKGGNANATKAHRRPGSIGVKGEAKVWPGRRLPGHMGYEWRHMHGLEVLRINPIKQILYIRGSVPGDVGETVLIKDCMMLTKRPKDPPFPTFYPPSEELEEEENGTLERMRNEIHLMTSRDIYSPKMFRFNQPTIEYTEANETAMATIEGRGAKIAKAVVTLSAGRNLSNEPSVPTLDQMDSAKNPHSIRSLPRLPQNVLVRIMQYLSLSDLSACMRVCRGWHSLIETYDTLIWELKAKNEVPESALADPYLFADVRTFKSKLRAFRFAWNPADSSRNNFVRTNGFTMHRQPVAQSTDGIRGKIGVSTGIHAFDITWEGPLGTAAVIGVATKHAALHCPGYVPLIGSDDQSWGWNLVDNSLLHNGQLISQYPRFNNPPKYQIGERIRMVLDSTHNQIYFEKGNEFFGLAFTQLPPVKLFPACCAVYGNTEVSMVYTGPAIVG